MSPHLSLRPASFQSLGIGGDERVRTDDPLLAKQVLSQLSYTPTVPRPSSFCPECFPFGARSKLYSTDPNKLRNPTIRSCAVIAPILFCVLPRKEVIQPHLPIRLPCYDFTPVAYPTFGCVLLAVKLQTSGVTNSHGVTGGVYKTRERIHRSMLICDY